jgi:DNA polymerase III alpha subunit
MLPLFKSHYSIGKSILKIDKKSYSVSDSNNIFYLLNSNNIKKLVLVEDSMTGFLEAFNNSIFFNVDLIFGLRLNLCQDSSIDSTKHQTKIIIFSKNEKGCSDLSFLFSEYNCSLNESLDLKSLSELWTENLMLAIPFYDSFLYYNYFYFNSVVLDLSRYNPCFFIENNGLPFDLPLKELVLNFCKKNNHNTVPSKSIYYSSKEDFKAYQTYKCICNRSFSTQSLTLENPKLDHCSSDDFSFESYLKYESA